MEQTIIVIVGAVFASQGFWTWLIHRNSNRSARSRLIMGLAFAEICRRSEAYINRGEISTDEYKDFEKYLYKPYKEMGGDGTADKLMDELKKLPIRRDA